MVNSPKERSSPAGNNSPEPARTNKGKQRAREETESGRNSSRTPSPSAGVKRAGTDPQSDSDDKSEQATDTRAIYDANKGEIDEWYDEEYSRKQGIPQYGKILRSNHRWYQKVAAWMKFEGMIQSPKKKRKLNDGNAVSGEMQEDRPFRPHKIRYSDDQVSVPEYPLDSLEDYTSMANGRYVCSHVHLEPPKQCCKFGLSKKAKRQSIKKSILRWKANIEKLVDKKQLDKQHMTWTEWTVPELRKKHQRELWNRQEAKKQADIKMKNEDERHRAKKPRIANQQAAQRRLAIQRSAPATNPRSQPFPPVSTTSDMMATPAAKPSAASQTQQPVASTRRQSDPDTIILAQSAFLTNLARTNPRLLRSHDVLYRDAQYRENMKEHPNSAHLKKWYLTYFLQQQRQPLSAEQRTLLESGDPSNDGRKRVSSVPAVEAVDKLFGEYIAHARQMQQQSQNLSGPVQPQKSSVSEQPQAFRADSPTPSQPLTTSTVRAESPAQAEAPNFNDVFEDAAVAPKAASEIQTVTPAAFEIYDNERLDRELDHILGTGPVYTTQPAVWEGEQPSQDAEALRTEASYLITLPQAFATGNQAADDELRRWLEYAYQPELTSQQSISEDEQLLRQTIEDGRPDWQRYIDFAGDEELRSGSPARAEEAGLDEFDFDGRLSEEQLALLDFDDPVGRQLFAQLDERVAAAHAANLARYR